MLLMHGFEEHMTHRFRSSQDGCADMQSRTADAYPRSRVLCAHGEIDLETAPVLRRALLPVLEHESGPVLVDLCEVRFMDLTGVHVLLEMRARLEARNRRLAVICREDGQVYRLLALVGLLDALTVRGPSNDAVLDAEAPVRSLPAGRRTRRGFGEDHRTPRALQTTPGNPGS